MNNVIVLGVRDDHLVKALFTQEFDYWMEEHLQDQDQPIISYTFVASYEQQGGAGDLLYPGPSNI